MIQSSRLLENHTGFFFQVFGIDAIIHLLRRGVNYQLIISRCSPDYRTNTVLSFFLEWHNLFHSLRLLGAPLHNDLL